MISMQGVPSSLVLRNESWVRKQAGTLARRLPSNVEKADLIQVGLIAVAQAALGFKWEGSHDTEEAQAAFVAYARQRVKGAMLDELRQMDNLSRAQRRKVKVVQVARERWQAGSDAAPTAADLSALSGLGVEEIFEIEAQAEAGRSAESLAGHEGPDGEQAPQRHEPVTEHDEVEARVDTGILLRRLETFFATLPERERHVIDAYLGVGLSPIKLAESMKVTPSRVSQMFRSLCERIGLHLSRTTGHRATDHLQHEALARFEALARQREADLAGSTPDGAWTQRLQTVLDQGGGPPDGQGRNLKVDSSTRWG